MFLLRNELILPKDEHRGPGSVQGLFRSGFTVVEVSLQPVNLASAPATGWFPALLDSGNSGTFALSRNHFQAWVAPALTGFNQVPSVTIRGATATTSQPVPRYEAALWFRSTQSGVPPLRVELSGGFALAGPADPPVPIIGVRTLKEGKLQLLPDYAAGTFSLSRQRRRFGEWLIDEGLATQADIDAVLRVQASLRFPSPTADMLETARLLHSEIRPGHVGGNVGELAASERLALPTPAPQAAPPLGDLLVNAGVLAASALPAILAPFLDPFWH